MKIFDRYVLKNLAISTLFIALTLAAVVFLTQSLRFLELVIESGASAASFWILTFLALPRFFEVILPLSMMAGTLFIYTRMTADSEMVVIRAAGFSPASLARPALALAMVVTVFLWFVTFWAAPKSLSAMYEMRQIIKSQFSALLFREGVFNQVGQGLTVYMRERQTDGELRGIMIHDSRDAAANPATILAKRGVLVAAPEGFQVLVYDGSRQEFDLKKGILHRLNFERYAIDLPDSEPVRERWQEPSERTIFELISPNLSDQQDADNLRDFKLEIHRRIAAPLLALVYTLMSCAALLLGPVGRRGQGWRIAGAVVSVITLQGLFLAASSLARQTDWGLLLMYALVFLPLSFMLFLLSDFSEAFRRRWFFAVKREVWGNS